MQSITDKEGNHDNIPSAGDRVTVGDPGILLHEHRVDLGELPARTDPLDLTLDGSTGILIVAGTMASDEQGDLSDWNGFRGGVLYKDGPGTRQDHPGHAVVGPDRPAVEDLLRTTKLPPTEPG